LTKLNPQLFIINKHDATISGEDYEPINPTIKPSSSFIHSSLGGGSPTHDGGASPLEERAFADHSRCSTPNKQTSLSLSCCSSFFGLALFVVHVSPFGAFIRNGKSERVQNQ
jgi:hypothetical protein